MSHLKDFFLNNKDRGIYKYLHYFDIYEHYFERFRNTDCCFLEIGVCEGGSLLMWKDYLGPKAQIYGIDQHDPDHIDQDQIKTFRGLQEDPEFIRSVISQIPPIDFMIDDGSHKPGDQIATFEAIWDHIKMGGVYLCEDMSHAYEPKEGGGLKARGSSIEYFKDLIDYQNRFPGDRGERAEQISQSVYSINFFMNLVVIEKKNLSETHQSPFRTGDWKYKELYGT
jgi:hypothetical protein